MLSSWQVLTAVANRHGSLQEEFDKSHDKLMQVKQGNARLIDLDENKARVELRLAREKHLEERGLERILDQPNFQDKFVLEQMIEKAHAVCRILRKGHPVGTGFLVGHDIIITNHHVIWSESIADEYIAEFDYELDTSQNPKASSCFRLDAAKFWLTSSLKKTSDPCSGLDFTLVGLQTTGVKGESLSQFTPVKLDGNHGKAIKGECCVIIQHPNGLPKKVVLKDIAFFCETNTCIIYESDTLPGSSGAMVIALGTCEIIALHHSGLPRTDKQGRIQTKTGQPANSSTPDDQIDWLGNEGIKISKIIEALERSSLPAHMNDRKQHLLHRSHVVKQELSASNPRIDLPTQPQQPATNPLPGKNTQTLLLQSSSNNMPVTPNPANDPHIDFLITALYHTETIQRIEAILQQRYGRAIQLSLVMPSAAEEGSVELFSFSAPCKLPANQEAQELTNFPDILNAEADTPIFLNADPLPRQNTTATESFNIDGDNDSFDESRFLHTYQASAYVKSNDLPGCRRWNWKATGFEAFLAGSNLPSPREAGIRIVQFDTGYTLHSKVAGGFDLQNDVDLISADNDALDPLTEGFAKQPGHGTRTGSLLIGIKDAAILNNGNAGLLAEDRLQLVPYRIAESVILINRQKQLGRALDRALSSGFDIITMSMGLPPTIATAKMAKKAYDRGVIWCCAAGNQVKAVVAPAVFPGTISVAASNPLDAIWKGSCWGDRVDVVAPGEHVYVPIINSDNEEGFAYGNGTSYATPHIAAAAAYWLAKYKKKLNSPEYAGWRRVEAFREALKACVDPINECPPGARAGKLNMGKLIVQEPAPANTLKYAYNSWNQHAFFSALQGWGEVGKSLWNRIHGWLGGSGAEAMGGQENVLSPTGAQLEAALFKNNVRRFETIDTSPENSLIYQYNIIQNLIEQSPKK